MSVTLEELAARARQGFTLRHGRAPAVAAAAPGRVNLIGEHTDYNDGFVLPMAIDRHVVVVGDMCDTGGPRWAEFYSAELASSLRIDLEEAITPESIPFGWGRYVAGVLAGFLERGHSLPSMRAFISSSVPSGGGLSSSAALEVAVATFLEGLLGVALDPVDRALLCQEAEHRFAGVPCGIMDQFSSVFGQEGALLLLDCRSREIELVPFSVDGPVVLIANSNVRHELAGGEYAERLRQCEAAAAALGVRSLRDATRTDLDTAGLDATIHRRARHVITEIERTVTAAGAIRESEWLRAGGLMYASHASLRDDYEVSCRELDLLVDIARELPGVLGSRMTGGGFGGCTVSLVEPAALESVRRSLHDRYHERSGREPTLFASRPARGARIVGIGDSGRLS